ncbi:sensor histidine kinase [Lachnospiraceae bacterium OttesenSCG-928-E19]|nr:sensor histidine kinase [Lachnospiraceae bacterium OttesenSCG-928-E19]
MKKLKKNQKNKKGLSLQFLVAAIMIVVSLILILVLSVFFINRYIQNTTESALRNSEQVVSQTATTIDNIKEQMESRMELLVREVEHCSNQEEVQKYMDNFSEMQQDVAGVYIYNYQGDILIHGKNGQNIKGYDIKNLSYDEELFNSNDKIILSKPHVQSCYVNYYPWVVTMAMKVDVDYLSDACYVVIDYQFSSIATYIDNVGVGQRGYCYIMDRYGDIIYHPKQRLIYVGVAEENMNVVAKLNDGKSLLSTDIYCKQEIDNGQWNIVGVSYVNELIESQVKSFRLFVMIIAAISIVLSILSSAIVSRRVSHPVRRLVKAMKEFERNVEAFEYQSENSIQEIRSLSDSFSHMVFMIRELLQRIKQEEISLRKTELKALEAQINPHFLYNTLDSIQWMCERGKAEEAVEMIGALAKLFRISISKGRDLITIRNEVQHAENYLKIQKFRYRDEFVYSLEFDEELLNYYCNKITLQPIIENAIYHGIDTGNDTGEIIIRGSREGDDILMQVIDNGQGMTEEQTATILQKERSDDSGIGLKNVNDRIKIYFGEEYGISIDSELDYGTTISIRLPIVHSEEEYRGER